jgi:hypothetical protein
MFGRPFSKSISIFDAIGGVILEKGAAGHFATV